MKLKRKKTSIKPVVLFAVGILFILLMLLVIGSKVPRTKSTSAAENKCNTYICQKNKKLYSVKYINNSYIHYKGITCRSNKEIDDINAYCGDLGNNRNTPADTKNSDFGCSADKKYYIDSNCEGKCILGMKCKSCVIQYIIKGPTGTKVENNQVIIPFGSQKSDVILGNMPRYNCRY